MRKMFMDDYDGRRPRKDKAAVVLLRGLNEFRKEGTLCDITLRVGEKTMLVHKAVISTYSPYFKAMFSGNLSELPHHEIHIKEKDANSMEVLIDYMYTGKLNIDSENMKELLLTASFLQIAKAEELCCSYMEADLDKGNCIEYLLFAGKNSIKRLVDSSIEKSSYFFPYIFSKNEYLELGFEEFKQLTQRLKESTYTEDTIYTFVMRWINYSYDTRINFIVELLEVLDPALISPNILYCSELVNTSNSMITTWGNTFRSPYESPEHILVTRRIGTFRPRSINIFSQDKVKYLEFLPHSVSDGSYVCNGYYIYHQGGWIDGELLTTCFTYNPSLRVWRPFGHLLHERAYHRSCALNGRIYSVGGSDGFKALQSVEFWDLLTGQRALTEPLPRAKERPGLGIHENSIYVVGGCNRSTAYKCIHRFDAREGMWQEMADSPYRAGASSCTVIGESIYTTHADILQRYDIRANNWAMVSAQCKRYPQEVFALDNRLFGLFSDHIARYVSEGGKWENQHSFEFNLSHLEVSTNLLCLDGNDVNEPMFEEME